MLHLINVDFTKKNNGMRKIIQRFIVDVICLFKIPIWFDHFATMRLRAQLLTNNRKFNVRSNGGVDILFIGFILLRSVDSYWYIENVFIFSKIENVFHTSVKVVMSTNFIILGEYKLIWSITVRIQKRNLTSTKYKVRSRKRIHTWLWTMAQHSK